MNKLSKGGVSIKTINNKKYFYYQWYENGKKRSRTISEDDYNRLKSNEINIGSLTNFKKFYSLDILSGVDLLKSISYLANWERRDCFKALNKYLSDPLDGKVMILYGLRRTGKTSLMFQAILEHKNEIEKTAYILVNRKSSMGDINLALNDLVKSGYKYVYIDEITLASDFVSSCQFLSDIYAHRLKIVLSGTDSFGFYISNRENLYNRSYTIHTTYIPFAEFVRVLKIDDIDKYIEFGGTLVAEGIDYHTSSFPTFFNEKTSMEYVDTAISRNIQNSLSNYNDGEKYFRLIGEKNEGKLTNIINRVVQDNNHRFVASIINRVFKSSDYGSLKELLRKNKYNEDVRLVLDTIDENKIYKSLMDRLDIVESPVEQEILDELYEFLEEIDTVKPYKIIDLQNQYTEYMSVFTQPGLRYAQARELLEVLLYQDALMNYPIGVIDIIFETLLNDVKGRILEEIVIIDTLYRKKLDVFKASFRIGEIDMCIYDSKTMSISLYEIKHSLTPTVDQTKHLLDQTKIKLIKDRYHNISRKCVLYRGPNQTTSGVDYINVEEFLKS